MNTRPLTEDEISQILAAINNKLAADTMNVSNVQGRTISIIKDGQIKKSGGIFVSHNEASNVSYKGIYYSLDDFLNAINNFIGSTKKEQTSTFTKKGKVEVDKEVVDEALHEFSSLYISKKNNSKNNADFYTVSRSNENSDSIKKTGGLITNKESNVKEGQYIDSAAAMKILSSIKIPEEEEKAVIPIIPVPKEKEEDIPVIVSILDEKGKENKPVITPIPVKSTNEVVKGIEVPTKKEVEEALDRIPKKKSIITRFTKRKLEPTVKEKVKDYAKKITSALLITGITILLLHGRVGDYPFRKNKDLEPRKTRIERVEETYYEPRIEKKISTIEKVKPSLRIGDIVEMKDGIRYDHNSQADDGGYGIIGQNPYRQEGEYTVDVIAILDGETNDIIGYTSGLGDSLDKLLERNNLTMDDVNSGKVKVRYNVSLGRQSNTYSEHAEESAGWVTYNQEDYEIVGNMGSYSQEALSEAEEFVDTQTKGGMSI
jgi:hypothetical protein